MTLSVVKSMRKNTPMDLVVAATADGDAFSQLFTPPGAGPDAPAYIMTLQALGFDPADLTALVLAYQVSLDGGTTWSNVADWDALAEPSTRIQVPQGGVHRLDITTFTTAAAPEVTVRGLIQ